jgi:Fe-S cluster assembly ATP-binding protein
MLHLHNFHAGIPHKEILHGIDLTIKPGQVHAIMGPNGAGKTTLAMSLMGHPGYEINGNSEFEIKGKSMVALLPEERAKSGLFVSFQSPVEITGVSFLAFLRTAYKALHPQEKIPLSEFKKRVKEALQVVSLKEEFMQRSVNEGFSGGERKRAEIAQLLVLRPEFVILDEIDSGLDIDSLKIVAQTVSKAVKEYNMGILIITHYQRILHFLKPNFVHILVDGKIKRTGKMNLVKLIEKEGYAAI